jgi:uncharacterized RDD family membrane protein YckC
MAEEPMSAPGAPPPAPEAPPPAPAANWQTAPPATVAGIPGFVFADVPNRFIALIVDGIILAVIGAVVSAVVAAIFGQQYTITTDANGFPTGVSTNFVSATVTLLLSLVVSAVYWIYTWTAMRGSPGMKVLGMQVGNYPDGATLTQNQAVRRWVALGGPLPLVQVLNQLPAIGALIGLAALAYYVYLLYSTAKSPTKQGFHDKYANSVVVKAARVA